MLTFRQEVLKRFYPLLMEAGKMLGINAGVKINKDNVKPTASFYDLSTTANDDTLINFSDFKGKHVLIVNTASDCGYTAQLSDLKKLHDVYADRLVILAFPSNDFKEQEKLSDSEIASFCVRTFGIPFKLAKKTSVLKGPAQHRVYQWLTDKNKNGWNNDAPKWNFSKFLINPAGVLTHTFGAGVSPLSHDVVDNLPRLGRM
jgi:glutathione peroxidase